jgi:integrase
MSSGKRRSRCSVERHRGLYRIRYRVSGEGVRERRIFPKKVPATSENEVKMRELANVIEAMLRAGLDPLELLRDDVPQSELGAPVEAPVEKGKERRSDERLSLTVAEFYSVWIAEKVPPLVRKAQQRDYRRHLEGYVLPALGNLPLAELGVTHMTTLRAQLLSRNGVKWKRLSEKFVRNILSASFRAFITSAVERGFLAVDPYLSPSWRRWPEMQDPEGTPEADPFTVEERDRILDHLRARTYGVHGKRRHHPAFWAYACFLFRTGARPSEASGLQWQDIALDRGFAIVRRSFHLGCYGRTKTKRSQRTVELSPEVVTALRAVQPLRVEPETPVFVGTDGTPIEPKTFSDRWYATLRALGVRVRGIYCMKDTCISLALMAGVNAHWLEKQTGVRLETLKRHYWKWLPSEMPGQLDLVRAFERRSGTAAVKGARLVPPNGPSLVPADAESDEDPEISPTYEVRGGGLEPPRVLPH